MDENNQSDVLNISLMTNKKILSILEEIKDSCEKKYPSEYKIIKKSLSDVSRELNIIIIEEIKNPSKTSTDENSKSKYKSLL